MLLGSTFYYRLNRDGQIVRDEDFDSCGPDRACDKYCNPDEIRVWRCDNWDGEISIGAGKNVRAKYGTDNAIWAAMEEAETP